MKNKIKITAIIIVIIIVALGIFLGFKLTGKAIDTDPSQISESCYIDLEINEEKINEEIQFSLLSQENIYGAHESHVNIYNQEIPCQYLLKTIDEQEITLNEYCVSSSRFLFYDTFEEENPGGIIEADSGVISEIIPYDENINSIKIENNGTETNLNINPAEIVCERTCKIENETGNYDSEYCCIGFIQSIQEDNSFVCVNCGDGVCSEYEDAYLCQEDCAHEFTCPEKMFKLNYGCSNKEMRLRDWKEQRISLQTLMGDLKNSILPML